MDRNALEKEIFDDLVNEIGISDNTTSMNKLSSKVKNAIREVSIARNYPNHYTEEMIVNDLYRHYSNIRKLSLYDYNQIGGEFQTSHNSNGTSRSWASRSDCLIGVVAMCNVF